MGFELDIYVPGRDTQTANCTQPNVSVTHAYVPTFHALYGYIQWADQLFLDVVVSVQDFAWTACLASRARQLEVDPVRNTLTITARTD